MATFVRPSDFYPIIVATPCNLRLGSRLSWCLLRLSWVFLALGMLKS